MRIEEIDYRICKIIKKYKETSKKNPSVKDIAKIICYTNQGTLYHLNKLESVGIVERTPDKEYVLKVTTLK